jgi:hypothetical protein
MKVVCIDDTGVTDTNGALRRDYVTCGKIYQVTDRLNSTFNDNGVYYIIGNDGTEVALRRGRFKLLDEYRLEKIEEILK